MSAGEGTGALRLLLFRVGGRRFALPLASVRGIQHPAEGLTPGATAEFHGRTVPVIDARELGWDGRPAGPRERPPALVVVAGAGCERALAVDGVEGLAESAGIREWPSLVAPFVRAAFLGLASQAGGEVAVVDPDALCGDGTAGARTGEGA